MYVKHEERTAWDFAIAGVAAVLQMDGDVCRKACIVLGGAAPKPWRSDETAAVLEGKSITEALAQQAGEAAMADAVAMAHNEYKIPTFTNMIRQAVLDIAQA